MGGGGHLRKRGSVPFRKEEEEASIGLAFALKNLHNETQSCRVEAGSGGGRAAKAGPLPQSTCAQWGLDLVGALWAVGWWLSLFARQE